MTEPAAYDAISERYRESKWLLLRHYIERFTLVELLGDNPFQLRHGSQQSLYSRSKSRFRTGGTGSQSTPQDQKRLAVQGAPVKPVWRLPPLSACSMSGSGIPTGQAAAVLW